MSDQQKRPRGRPRLGRKTVRLDLLVPEVLHLAATECAAAEGIPVAELVRAGLVLEITRRERARDRK